MPAPVINLAQLVPTITVARVRDAIIERMVSESAGKATIRVDNDMRRAVSSNERCKQNASWEWIYGTTPKFSVGWDVTIDGKNVCFTVDVVNGKIENVANHDQLALTGAVEDIVAAVREAPFRSVDIESRLRAATLTPGGRSIAACLTEFLRKSPF